MKIYSKRAACQVEVRKKYHTNIRFENVTFCAIATERWTRRCPHTFIATAPPPLPPV
jgi:hypothetical protein